MQIFSIFSIAKSNPRTTIAGVAGLLSMLAGMLATYQGGALWLSLFGLALRGACDALGHALAADAAKGAP